MGWQVIIAPSAQTDLADIVRYSFDLLFQIESWRRKSDGETIRMP